MLGRHLLWRSLACAAMRTPCTCHARTVHAPCTRAAPWVRSAAGNYHRDVGAAPTAKFEAQGCRVEALGGGRITLDSKARCREV